MPELLAVSALVAVGGALMIRRDFLFRPQNVVVMYSASCIVMGVLLAPYDIYETQVEGPHFARSFHLYAAGFIALCAGIIAKPALFPGRAREKHVSVSIDMRALTLLLIAYAAAGAALELYTFSAIGMVPLFSDNPLITKYIVQAMEEFRIYNPFYTLGMNLLTVSSTVSLLMLVRRRGRLRWALALTFVASLGCLALTLTRGYIVYAAVMAVMALVYMGELRLTRAAAAVGVLAAASIGMWYMGDAAEASPLHGVANNYFLNVKEFARVLVCLDGKGQEPLMGGTYFATVVSPLPSVINPVKDKYHLGRVILGILGDDPYVSATPRIGMVGESFLNFGAAGVAAVSFVFGLVVKRIDGLYHSIKNNVKGDNSLHMLYLSFIVLQPLVFFYESGSVSLMYFIMMSILSAPLYVLAVKRTKRGGRPEGEK